MSCSRGSKRLMAGANAAVRNAMATTNIPKSEVRRRTRRVSNTTHSRSAQGRAATNGIDSVTAEWGGVIAAQIGRAPRPPRSSACAAAQSSKPDARIQIRVEHVHEEIDDHEGAGEEKDGGLDHRIVA